MSALTKADMIAPTVPGVGLLAECGAVTIAGSKWLGPAAQGADSSEMSSVDHHFVTIL
jgi:hypothetical protein